MIIVIMIMIIAFFARRKFEIIVNSEARMVFFGGYQAQY